MTYLETKVEIKRYEDGTIKKIRKIYINHIEVSQQHHIEVSLQNHIEENFSYNNTSNNNTSKKEIYKEKNKKPSLEEIEKYCKERNNNVNPKKFYDYYEANNWIDNKGNKVKSWKQKVITWESRDIDNKLPTWFGKEIQEEQISEKDKKEIEDWINDYE